VPRPEHPVTPRGIVPLENLLCDGDGSPLYRPQHAAELGQALTTVRRAIEPSGDAQAGSTSR
jgi:hypothetical protein